MLSLAACPACASAYLPAMRRGPSGVLSKPLVRQLEEGPPGSPCPVFIHNPSLSPAFLKVSGTASEPGQVGWIGAAAMANPGVRPSVCAFVWLGKGSSLAGSVAGCPGA